MIMTFKAWIPEPPSPWKARQITLKSRRQLEVESRFEEGRRQLSHIQLYHGPRRSAAKREERKNSSCEEKRMFTTDDIGYSAYNEDKTCSIM